MLKNVTISDIHICLREHRKCIGLMQIRTLRIRANNEEVLYITGRINYKANYLLKVWVEFNVIVLNKAKHNV